jgi:alginate O-acetyltransferase complex protein AlgJ
MPSSAFTLAATPKHTLLCAAFFSAIMAFGAFQIVGASLHPDGLDYPRGLKDFREGISTQALEKQLDQKMSVRQTFIAIANTTRYQLFSGGGEQVRVGKNDWLFLTDELRYEGEDGKAKNANPAQAMKARMDLIAATSKRLEGQGVRLLLALVPDKARLYSEQLKGGIYPAYNQSRYLDALKALDERQVATVNLLAPLSQAAMETKEGELYYRTDTHWNQRGAKLAAQTISKQVAALKLDIERTEFTTKAGTTMQERPGDLIRLMGLEPVPNVLRPRPDQETPDVTTEKGAEKAKQGLFGDSAVPVVLTGTSYSMRGNFHGYLQEFLAAKVLNTAKDGGGFLQAITTYLKDDAFKAAKPKVLIWEVPERMLRSPLDGEGTWLEKSGL